MRPGWPICAWWGDGTILLTKPPASCRLPGGSRGSTCRAECQPTVAISKQPPHPDTPRGGKGGISAAPTRGRGGGPISGGRSERWPRAGAGPELGVPGRRGGLGGAGLRGGRPHPANPSTPREVRSTGTGGLLSSESAAEDPVTLSRDASLLSGARSIGGGGFSPEGVEWTSDCGRDTLDIVPVAGKTPHTGGAAHHRRRAGVRHAANSSTCRTSPRSERASSPFADPTEARRRALDGIAPRSPDRATVASRMKRQRKVVSRQSEASSAPGGLAYGSYTPPMYSDRGG